MKFDYLIVAGGKKVSKTFLKKAQKVCKTVVGVDKGQEQLIKSDIFVGDGDSYINKPNARKVVWLNPQKSISDLEFIVQHLPAKATKLILSSHLDHESRVDHALVNLHLPFKYKNIFLADEQNFIFLVQKKLIFKTKKSSYFSLLSLNNTKITVQGAAYNCKNLNFKNLTQGLSNKTFKLKKAVIKVNKPTLILINTDFSQVI